MQALDIDDVIAHLLIAEGFAMVEDIAIPVEELMTIQGFDEDIAAELSRRAIEFIEVEAPIAEGLTSLVLLKICRISNDACVDRACQGRHQDTCDLADLDGGDVVSVAAGPDQR